MDSYEKRVYVCPWFSDTGLYKSTHLEQIEPIYLSWNVIPFRILLQFTLKEWKNYFPFLSFLQLHVLSLHLSLPIMHIYNDHVHL